MSGITRVSARDPAAASAAPIAAAPAAPIAAAPAATAPTAVTSLTEPATVTSGKYTWCDSKLVLGLIVLVLTGGIGCLFWGLSTLSEEKKKKKNDYIIATYVLGSITIFLLCCLLIAILLCDPSYDNKISILIGFIVTFYIASNIGYIIINYS
jgi:hypothetical protein